MHGNEKCLQLTAARESPRAATEIQHSHKKKEKWKTANNTQSVNKAIHKIKFEINNKIDKKNFKSNKHDIVLKFFSFVSSVLPSHLEVG